MSSCVRYTRDGQSGVATLTLDLPGKSVNTLSRQMWADLDAALAQAEADKPAGLLVASGKPRSFVAGADLFELRDMTDEQLDHYLADGQRILARLEGLTCPTVAVLNGDALGGGLEVALACRHRVSADDTAIKLGLPEVQLGLVPGWGGTVRLARLVGVGHAVTMASGGRPIGPDEALKVGLVDRVVPREGLLAVAAAMLASAEPPPRRAPTEDDLSFLAATEVDFERKHGSHNPAPLRIVRVIRAAAEGGLQAGYDAERRGLVELRNTPAGRNLLRLFFLRQSARKDAARAAGGTPRDVARVAVIGGGTMGGGIVHAFVKAGVPVTCVEAEAFVKPAAERLAAALAKDGLPTDRHAFATDLATAVRDADLVVEAISEDLAAKESLFRALDRATKPSAVLASNTSSLSIARLAGCVGDGSRVVGLHFFNPVPRMPLVEIVRHPGAGSDAIATAVAVGTRLGKTPIVSGDGPGFIVNRVLMPYLSESMRLAGEGVSVESIDRAVRAWGMPMGPFELMDQIGLDVIVGIFAAMRPALGERVETPAALLHAVESKQLGRKSGRGFFVYPPEKGAKPTPNADVLGRFGPPDAEIPADAITDRCLLPMANEAARVMEEGVTDAVDAIDLACVTGLGMAGWRGGIVRHVLDTGISTVVSRLQALAAKHGDHLNPSEHLWKMAEAGKV